MKPFTFRLERVLRYRKHLETQAQQELFKARNVVTHIKEEIDRLTTSRVKTDHERMVEEAQGIDVARHQLYQGFVQKIEHDLEATRSGLNRATSVVETRRGDLHQAAIRKKTLESLREAKQQQYREQTARQEQRLLDELVLLGKR